MSEHFGIYNVPSFFSRTGLATFSFFMFFLILGLKGPPLGPKRAGAKRLFFGAKRLFKGPAALAVRPRNFLKSFPWVRTRPGRADVSHPMCVQCGLIVGEGDCRSQGSMTLENPFRAVAVVHIGPTILGPNIGPTLAQKSSKNNFLTRF